MSHYLTSQETDVSLNSMKLIGKSKIDSIGDWHKKSLVTLLSNEARVWGRGNCPGEFSRRAVDSFNSPYLNSFWLSAVSY